MSGITGIWIIMENGEMLFNYELFTQGSEEYDSALFSGFILSIQRFIKELGEKKTERIEMGSTKIFIAKDVKYNLIFVIRTTQDVSNKKVFKLLDKIQNRFAKKFGKFLIVYTVEELRIYIDNIFRTEIEDILGDVGKVARARISKFFDST